MTKDFKQIATVIDGLFPSGKFVSGEKTMLLPPLVPQSSEANGKRQAAAKAIKVLFSWCPMPDVGDQEVYLAGAVAILAEYPSSVIDQIADPRSATLVLRDYPSLFALRKACEKINEPFQRQEDRLQRWSNSSRALPDLRTLSPEEKQRRCEHVERVFAELKLNPRWLQHNKPLVQPLSAAERARLEAELEAMRQRPDAP